MEIQNTENELQKAIDDIAKNAAGDSSAVAGDASGMSELDAKVQDQLGVPPVPEADASIPPVPEMPVGGELPMPGTADAGAGVDAGSTDSGAGSEGIGVVGVAGSGDGSVAPDAPLTIDESSLPKIELKAESGVEAPAENAEVSTGEAEASSNEVEVSTGTEETAVAGDFKEIKAAALKDLYPLLDKIQVNAEQKCKIYREAYEATKDETIIAKLYEAIKGIEDEKARAEQLLYVVGL